MTFPVSLPAWVPWWVQLLLLVALVLVAGAYVMMPFSVFGLKARIEALDERIDELQSDLRDLINRLPDPEMRRPAAWRRSEPDEDGYMPRAAPADDMPVRAPMPPVPMVPERMRDRAPPASPYRDRSEPQLRWPRDR